MLRDTLRTRTRTRGRVPTDPACTLMMARLNTLAPDAGSVQLPVDDPERLHLVDDDHHTSGPRRPSDRTALLYGRHTPTAIASEAPAIDPNVLAWRILQPCSFSSWICPSADPQTTREKSAYSPLQSSSAWQGRHHCPRSWFSVVSAQQLNPGDLAYFFK